ncbi:2-amino-4-hydroxy-6-hydroxymethyldihydropteridine diphosphokinase [Salinisphaera sp. P385]|uniref:2-amino-4-hydroxy-6-hydroxymethyldihydropteridine pyrophosphokinase n=1 Tax=Spectribacter acetivorans TaxID=3075603 RepID=A0ABU3B652_9GAMM|nr:2-amino-4-hydroxy-6-hydroxymethyldihydropteridine diphosphokinase [Salinisphaera sp. P385]MDT0617729.1 2-amino-4-hydroxy-6-hydroxymethyldihydropteridine diphosphokinase [Salinisphaera sp. P385]
MNRVWIGLGSNLDDPAGQVRAGLTALAGLPDSRPGPVSDLFRSAPVGVTDQPDFCNAVAGLDTDLEPLALLEALQAIEQAAGRRRTRRWGPRTLDLDMLVYGDRRIDLPTLTVPHPRLAERAFVLVPLVSVAPNLDIPGQGAAATLAAGLDDQGVRPWAAAS